MVRRPSMRKAARGVRRAGASPGTHQSSCLTCWCSIMFVSLLNYVGDIAEKGLDTKLRFQQLSHSLDADLLRVVVTCRDEVDALLTRDALARFAGLAR